MNFQFENSTMLKSVSYGTDTHEMTVVFAGGKSYTYKDVDQNIYNELISAKSAGKYFNSIKKELVQK
jgi:hypothetical protein